METVNLALGATGGGATLGAWTTAELRIVDDEVAFAFSTANYTVGEGVASPRSPSS